MEKMVSEIIRNKFDKGIILLSTSNLAIDIQASKGIEIGKNKIARELKNNKNLLPINSSQFIKFENIKEDIGIDKYNDLLKTKEFNEIILKIKTIITENHPVFNIHEELIMNYLKEEYERKRLYTEIVRKFNEYYNKNNSVVVISMLPDIEFDNKRYKNSQVKSLIDGNNIFYKVSGNRFALVSWILLEIARKAYKDYSIVNFNYISNIVEGYLGTFMLNSRNLRSLLQEWNQFEFFENNKKVKFNSNYKCLEQNIIDTYKKNVFIEDIKIYYNYDSNGRENKSNNENPNSSFESILENGIRNGYVEYEKLLELNYEDECVSDQFEAVDVLDKKNIEIFYD